MPPISQKQSLRNAAGLQALVDRPLVAPGLLTERVDLPLALKPVGQIGVSEDRSIFPRVVSISVISKARFHDILCTGIP